MTGLPRIRPWTGALQPEHALDVRGAHVPRHEPEGDLPRELGPAQLLVEPADALDLLPGAGHELALLVLDHERARALPSLGGEGPR